MTFEFTIFIYLYEIKMEPKLFKGTSDKYPTRIYLMGERHNVVYHDFLPLFLENIQNMIIPNPVIFVEYRRFYEKSTFTPDQETRFLKEAPLKLSPVTFFSLCIENEIKLYGNELIAYDYRVDEVINSIEDIDNYLRSEEISSFTTNKLLKNLKTAWDFQYEKANDLLDEVFKNQVSNNIDTLQHDILGNNVESVICNLDILYFLWCSISEKGMLKHFSDYLIHKDPQNIFVFMGEDHIPDIIKIMVDIGFQFEQISSL
jgi:hypothetical protein